VRRQIQNNKINPKVYIQHQFQNRIIDEHTLRSIKLSRNEHPRDSPTQEDRGHTDEPILL